MDAMGHVATTSNIVSPESLRVRLDLNSRYGRHDFHSWITQNYRYAPGMHILDVGCGNGAQALRALELIGESGSVSALDISPASVAELRETAARLGFCNLELAVADMVNLGAVVQEKFRTKTFDLVHSTYALGYATDPIAVLDSMRAALKPSGRMIVATPIDPNSFRELVKRLGARVPKLDAIGRLPQTLLEPYFRSFFDEVSISIRRNLIAIPTVEEALSFFRSAAYFDAALEEAVADHVRRDISRLGYFPFEKNNYMIVGEGPN